MFHFGTFAAQTLLETKESIGKLRGRVHRYHGIPLVVTYHSTRILGVKEQLQMMLYRPFFWNADCSIFVSNNQRKYSLRRGVLARDSEVIYNGVDTAHFRNRLNPAQRMVLRRQLGFSDQDYLISIAACSLVNFLVSDRWVFRAPLWPVSEVRVKATSSNAS